MVSLCDVEIMDLLRSFAICCLAGCAPLYADAFTVGKYPAKVVPEQASTLTFTTKGDVTGMIYSDCRRIEKDTVIGIIDKEKLDEEREDMELQLTRERLTKRDEIRKLEAQREQIKFYLKLTPAERTYAKDTKAALEQEPTAEALKDIDDRITLLRKELNTIERRKRTEFNNKHEKSVLKMPFTGRLQYNVTLPEDPSTPYSYIPSITGQPFASVCDDSAFYITISLASPDLILLPEERFSAYIELPGGKRMSGTYAFRRVEKGSGTDVLAYFFKIDPSDHDTAFNMLGSVTRAYLVYSVEADVERVSKMQLLAHPSARNCEDWKQLVSVAYPGYSIVVITERDILIRKQTQSDTDS